MPIDEGLRENLPLGCRKEAALAETLRRGRVRGGLVHDARIASLCSSTGCVNSGRFLNADLSALARTHAGTPTHSAPWSRPVNREPFIVWGPELSPFVLKLESLLVHAGLPLRRLPRDGSRMENIRTSLLIDRAKLGRTARRPDGDDPLDEYPLVPFLVTPQKDVLYDSSALARWLDARPDAATSALVPTEPPIRFVCSLLDESFDEFVLYMVHHNRWKLAAADNDNPGGRLAREYAKLLPPGTGKLFARWFARRQVRRLPYLFSVAPDGYRVAGLAPTLTPPGRAGYPPTHELLEQTWTRTLSAIEAIL
ncbi:MAG: glutathione S-transferase N-terminal domain-containing protein, partial [Candidatus Binatia bacterium]